MATQNQVSLMESFTLCSSLQVSKRKPSLHQNRNSERHQRRNPELHQRRNPELHQRRKLKGHQSTKHSANQSTVDHPQIPVDLYSTIAPWGWIKISKNSSKIYSTANGKDQCSYSTQNNTEILRKPFIRGVTECHIPSYWYILPIMIMLLGALPPFLGVHQRN